MSARTDVAVVAVTYHSADALGPFLDSLAAASSRPVEVVLADNGPDDGTLAAFADRPGVRLMRTGGNLGYGTAANVGVAALDTEFVVVANPDIVWEPGALDVLVEAAGRHPDAGSFGPLIRTPEGEIYPSARALPSLGRGIGHALAGWWWPSNPWTASYRLEREAPRERSAGWLSGACLLLRRTAFQSVGGFDESYFMYFEDLDLGDRLTRAGWQNVYVPSAVVTHVGAHSTSKNAAAMAVEHHRSAWRYLSRRYTGLRWLPLRIVLRAGLAARAVLARRSHRVAAGAPAQRHD